MAGIDEAATGPPVLELPTRDTQRDGLGGRHESKLTVSDGGEDVVGIGAHGVPLFPIPDW